VGIFGGMWSHFKHALKLSALCEKGVDKKEGSALENGKQYACP
jgi:hypothetical protein